MSFLRQLRPVSVLANGVLGQTGIETAELIFTLRDTLKPQAVVAIDALACSDLSRRTLGIQSGSDFRICEDPQNSSCIFGSCE